MLLNTANMPEGYTPATLCPTIALEAVLGRPGARVVLCPTCGAVIGTGAHGALASVPAHPMRTQAVPA